MINKNIKKNISLFKNKIKGFTLVETLVAVFILTFTIVALMFVVSDSLFAARYARNEITAIYLAQEASDYIRNDRDTLFFSGDDGWEEFSERYQACFNFNEDGCYFEVLKLLRGSGDEIQRCEDELEGTNIKCPFLYYSDETEPFYTYVINSNEKPRFQRKIFMREGSWTQDQDEVILTVTIYWRDSMTGTTKEIILETTLTKWQ